MSTSLFLVSFILFLVFYPPHTTVLVLDTKIVKGVFRFCDFWYQMVTEKSKDYSKVDFFYFFS